MRYSSQSLALLFCFCLRPVGLQAGVEIVEIDKIQVSQSLSAIVVMPDGSPLPSAKVEEVSSDWKTVLRTVQTDAGGTFTLAPVKGRNIYYIQVSAPGFNSLRFRLKRKRYARPLKVQIRLST
jgi:hypothetical protein